MSPSSAAQAIAYLRNPRTIRAHCKQIGLRAEQGILRHFNYYPERLPEAIRYVVDEMQRNYPQGNIPIHGRMRHLVVGGVDRPALVRQRLQGKSALEKAKSLFELVVISVLLDGGAGGQWSYRDELSGASWSRSEGLAVASFNMFWRGIFAQTHESPLQISGQMLSRLSEEQLAAGMQVTLSNTLLGLPERCELLRQLGHAIICGKQFFSGQDSPRLGDLLSYLLTHTKQEGGRKTLATEVVFTTLLEAFADIWPHSVRFAGVNIGDVGSYVGVHGHHGCDGLVPFHKLTQWLTYSLLELLSELGVVVKNSEVLTGLPEYRNGGLLVDLQVLRPQERGALLQHHDPQGELVVEWRALTVYLLDKLADGVRKAMGRTAAELSLASILQGGTWSAGRRIAQELRRDGGSPLKLRSDGTIF